MNRWGGYSYVPVVRTRDAELKGLREVVPSRLNKILPVFEFTRSRRSKTNPSGAMEISVERVREIIGERTFIADVTSLDSQSNSEVHALLDDGGGFSNWVSFVTRSLGPNAIPVLHLTDPFDELSLRRQIAGMRSTQTAFALRLPTSYIYSRKALEAALGEVEASRLIVLLDAGYIRPDTEPAARSALAEMARVVERFNPGAIVPLASTFPSSVVADGYGEDSEGEFPLGEVIISDFMKAEFSEQQVIHGDYACVHPLDFEGTVTAWVPRVDVPLDTKLFYHRYRRPKGGYVAAAQKALGDPRYVALPGWAHDNIVKAAKGDPLGKSPSHWIAVRLNYHITRQVRRLTGV